MIEGTLSRQGNSGGAAIVRLAMSSLTKLGVCVLIGFLAACGQPTSTSQVARSSSIASLSADDLAGHTFDIARITYAGVDEPLAPGTSPAITFTPAHFQVETGCNYIGADYAIAGTQLTVADAVITAMGCADSARTAQEGRIARALDATAEMTTSADGFTITDGPTTLTLARQ